jgi:hypothetical protein
MADFVKVGTLLSLHLMHEYSLRRLQIGKNGFNRPAHLPQIVLQSLDFGSVGLQATMSFSMMLSATLT